MFGEELLIREIDPADVHLPPELFGALFGNALVRERHRRAVLGVVAGDQGRAPFPEHTPEPERRHECDQPQKRRDRGLASCPLDRSLELCHRLRHDRQARQEPPQIVGQRRRALIPLPRFLLQALEADRLEIARNGHIEPPRRHWFGADYLEYRLHRGGRLERRPARDQRIEGRPQGINVGRRPHVAPIPSRLLGRHVVGRTHDLAGTGQSAVILQLLRQTEISDARIAVPVEQDVGRLQVTVDHAAPVGILDGVGNAPSQPGGLSGRQRSVGQALGEAMSVDKTHRKVMLPLVLSHLENRDDPRMVKVGGSLGLGVEALDVCLVGKLSGQDHLERNRPV